MIVDDHEKTYLIAEIKRLSPENRGGYPALMTCA